MPTIVTYLEMRSPDALRPKESDDPRFRVMEATVPQWRFNRFLYLAVGADWNWTEMRDWSDERWRAYVEDERVRTWCAWWDGSPAGYFELRRDDEGGVEIVHFGLLPAFVGRGLGGPFLTFAVRTAWSLGVSRVWLHTCDRDHPSALKNYEARGFVRHREEIQESAASPCSTETE